MTIDSKIAFLRKAMDETPQGPWSIDDYNGVKYVRGPNGEAICILDCPIEFRDSYRAFICASRNICSDLIDEIYRLRIALDDERHAHAENMICKLMKEGVP